MTYDGPKIVRPPRYKSVPSIVEFGRRMLRLVQNADVRMVAYVAVGRDGRVHMDHSSGMSLHEKDMLLTALEDLHEEVYLDA